MIKRFRAYFPFTKAFIQSSMAYGWNFWVYVIGGVLRVFITFFLWQAIYQSSSSPSMGGFTFMEMAAYVFITEIVIHLAFNDADWFVSNDVKTGMIAMNLIRPISYHLRILFMTFGQFLFELVVVCVPIWCLFYVFGYFNLGLLPPEVGKIALFIVSSFFAFLMIFFFNLSFGFLAFYLTNIWGLSFVKHAVIAFFSGVIIPLSFFPDWSRPILEILPFSSMVSTPVLIYLGKLEEWDLLRALVTQVFWAAFFFLASQGIYRGAISKITIHGG